MGLNVIQQHLPRLTVCAQVFVAAAFVEPELRAVAVAETQELAAKARLREVRFHGREPPPNRALHDGGHVVFDEIAEPPGRLDEEVAGIAVAVVLDDEVAVAGIHPAAGDVDAVDEIDEDVLEEPDRGARETVGDPEIEDGSIEGPYLRGAHGEVLESAGFSIPLQAVDELEEDLRFNFEEFLTYKKFVNKDKITEMLHVYKSYRLQVILKDMRKKL